MAIITDSLQGTWGTPGSWDDELVGSAEDDTLYSGKGNDRLDGGAGADTFVFNHPFANAEVRFDPADGSYRVGNAVLHNIEYIRFLDVTVPIADTLPNAGVQHRSTDGDDRMVSSDLGYGLGGGGGNDTLLGNGGDDTLYGGKGEDTAIFRGDRADYRILFDYNNHRFVVQDSSAGRDGHDTLADIELLQFANTTIELPALGGRYDPLTPEQLAQLDGVIGSPPEEPDWIGWVGGGPWIDDPVVIDYTVVLQIQVVVEEVVSVALAGVATWSDAVLP